MQLELRTEQGLAVVAVQESRIDAAVALAFKEGMRQHTDGPAPIVVLDLSGVQFIDSSGLGAVVASMKALGPGRKLALSGMTPTVDKVFRLTRMDTIFPIFDHLEDAITQLAETGG